MVFPRAVKLGLVLRCVLHLVLPPDHDVVHLLTEAQALGVVNKGANGSSLALVILVPRQLSVLFVFSLVRVVLAVVVRVSFKAGR
jgi:hypothetical protein